MDDQRKWENVSGQITTLLAQLQAKGYIPENPPKREEGLAFLSEKFEQLYKEAEQSGQARWMQFAAAVRLDIGQIAFQGDFVLRFSYDPERARLEFNEVGLGRDKDSIAVSYRSDGSSEMPPASEVVERFVHAIVQKAGRYAALTTDQKAERIEGFTRSYQELLEEKGYVNRGPDGEALPGQMKAALRTAFARCLAPSIHPTEEMLLVTGFKATDKQTGEKFDFEFHFKYDPQKVHIRMDAVIAKGEHFKIFGLPQSNSSFPTLPEMIRNIQKAKAEAKKLKQPPGKPKKGPRL